MNERDNEMQSRIDIQKVVPGAFQAMLGLEAYVRRAWHAEPLLLGLVKMRASQINGCAYCIDMHSKDARAHGETEQRLYALNAWKETPFFSDRERAALLWTEAITLISKEHAPDAVYDEVRRCFTEEELMNLTLAIVAINGWNRLCIGFRAVPGDYEPKAVDSYFAKSASEALPSDELARR
jgi:AhpD family alkylhydroperoxidase